MENHGSTIIATLAPLLGHAHVLVGLETKDVVERAAKGSVKALIQAGDEHQVFFALTFPLLRNTMYSDADGVELSKQEGEAAPFER